MPSLDPSILEQAARLYGLSPGTLHPLAGGYANYVFGFVRDGRESVLRISPPGEELNLASMRGILSWMDYLAQNDAPVPAPVVSAGGKIIEVIPAHPRPYVLTAWQKAVGVLAETLPFDAWSPELIGNMGRAVGRLHSLATSYRLPNEDLRRPHWDQITNCFKPSEELPGEPDATHGLVRQKQEQVLAAVRCLPRDGSGYGLVHADLHLANFFVDQARNAVTLFDFDDCCYGWFIMDLALPLLDFLVVYPRPEPEESARYFFFNFWQGYRSENDLGAFWLEQLPLILKLLEIGLYSEVYGVYDPAHPETWVGKFMSDRKSRIERDVPPIALDFARLVEKEFPAP